MRIESAASPASYGPGPISKFRRKPPAQSARSGFTLTDLVAVIATGALLMLLILPSLAGPGDQSTRTKCFNNLRQLGQAMLMYATDNHDNMAWPNWSNDSGKRGWLYTASNGYPPAGGYASGAWFAYTQSTGCYLCPVDLQSPYYIQRDNQLSSYVMNGAVCGYGTATSACKMTDAWSPECYLLYEPDEYLGSPPIGAFAFNDASSYPNRNESIGRLHSPTSAYILKISGSVKSVTYSEYQAQQNSNTRSLAWWSPFSANGR